VCIPQPYRDVDPLKSHLIKNQNQNQNVNVQRAIKNRQEVSLVYCTNQTKGLMETLKRKPLSRPVSVKAVRWKGWGLWREGFKEKVSFEFRVE